VNRGMARFALLIGFGLVLGLGWQAPASAKVVFNQKFPIAAVVGNFCTEEDVYFEGFAHIVVNQEQQQDGSTVSTTRATYHAKGIGLESGNEYVGNETDQSTAISPPGGGSTEVVTVFFRFISLGKLPNELLRDAITIITSPSGNVSVSVSGPDFVCPGSDHP
jgi:hypothetical protein